MADTTTAAELDSSFIKAVPTNALNGHPQWQVRNKKSDAVLGLVFWYPAWRQYCFTQYEYALLDDSGVVWSHDCLRAVSDFCLYRTREARQ